MPMLISGIIPSRKSMSSAMRCMVPLLHNSPLKRVSLGATCLAWLAQTRRAGVGTLVYPYIGETEDPCQLGMRFFCGKCEVSARTTQKACTRLDTSQTPTFWAQDNVRGRGTGIRERGTQGRSDGGTEGAGNGDRVAAHSLIGVRRAMRYVPVSECLMF